MQMLMQHVNAGFCENNAFLHLSLSGPLRHLDIWWCKVSAQLFSQQFFSQTGGSG
jgi:hypothetical protein